MKVEGPSTTRTTTVRRSGGAAPSGSSVEFSLPVDGEESAPAEIDGLTATSPVSALYALQEVEDPTQGRRKARQRASSLLDKLDELRHGLLTGTLCVAQLHELTRLLATQRASVDDPGLLDVLDQIDLRAQVELAKLMPD